MRKLLSILLVGLLFVTLIGCENKDNDRNTDNDREKDKNTQVVEKVKKEELEIDDPLVVKYYDLLRDDQGEYYSSNVSKSSTKASDLDDAQKLNIAARLLTSNEVKQDKSNNVSFTRTTLNNYVKEVFGEDTELDYSKLNEINIFVQRENSPIKGMYLYGNYTSKNDTYNMTWGGIGSSCGFTDCVVRHSKLESAYVEGDYLYITEKQLFLHQDWNQSSGEFNKGTIYKDVDLKNSIGTIKKYDASVDEFYEKGASVTLVFKKEKDNYIFVESIVE